MGRRETPAKRTPDGGGSTPNGGGSRTPVKVQTPGGQPGIMKLLTGPAGASQLNMVEILSNHLHQGSLAAEVKSAAEYCSKHLTSEPNATPVGLRAPLSTPSAVRDRLKVASEVMFGGALGMMDLNHRLKTWKRWTLGACVGHASFCSKN